jgi:hypothetical protein
LHDLSPITNIVVSIESLPVGKLVIPCYFNAVSGQMVCNRNHIGYKYRRMSFAGRSEIGLDAQMNLEIRRPQLETPAFRQI